MAGHLSCCLLLSLLVMLSMLQLGTAIRRCGGCNPRTRGWTCRAFVPRCSGDTPCCAGYVLNVVEDACEYDPDYVDTLLGVGTFCGASTDSLPNENMRRKRDVTDDSDAGNQPISPFIVGGQDATYGDDPWQVVVTSSASSSRLCAGALISETWVLTTASCVSGLSVGDLVLSVGVHSLSGNDPGKQTSGAEAVYKHPKFNFVFDNIALVKLATPFDLSGQYVVPACLPRKCYSSNFHLADVTYRVSGHGLTAAFDVRTQGNATGRDTEEGVRSDILQTYEARLQRPSVCKRAAGLANMWKILCARGVLGTTTCNSDVGAPLTYGNVVIGLNTYSYQTCNPTAPVGFAHVSPYLTWIMTNLENDAMVPDR